MDFKTLENISIADLVHTFNEAFSDYAVPMHLSKEQLINKFIAESINKEYSIGAFDGDKLVGFILHGIEIVENVKTAYNGGTGVIPSYRGNKLTTKLYDAILPVLKNNSVRKIQLEVLSENIPAIKTYSSIGFQNKRLLNCYKGSIADHPSDTECSIHYIYHPNWKLLQTYWDWIPSWQNAMAAVNNSWSQLDSIGIFEAEQLLGYVIFNPKINRIHQLAISKEHRGKGVGKHLMKYISQNKSKTVSILNVDDNSKEMNNFLSSLGLTVFVKQNEMELDL